MIPPQVPSILILKEAIHNARLIKITNNIEKILKSMGIYQLKFQECSELRMPSCFLVCATTAITAIKGSHKNVL